MQGRIHSLESFGTVDGPGTRFVVFVQGCPMRCAYCHNPDTWAMTGGTMMEPAEIIEQYERNRPFYKDGGLTVTGGEPLMQIDFLIDLFTLAKEKDIHTCIDTSGIAFKPGNTALIEKLDKLMTLTNLVMLDIKHIDPEKHKELTQQPNDGILAFAAYLNEKQIPMWMITKRMISSLAVVRAVRQPRKKPTPRRKLLSSTATRWSTSTQPPSCPWCW